MKLLEQTKITSGILFPANSVWERSDLREQKRNSDTKGLIWGHDYNRVKRGNGEIRSIA